MQDAFSASIAGVYLCGVAGSLDYQRVGLHMVATDLIDMLDLSPRFGRPIM
jgi:NAD(P)H-hydrate repair Nnr-like enzyme with NAD(P)H-hydrate dehydratase domain